MHRIRFWQWPNILALDAALIALAWQAVFTQSLGFEMGAPAQIVLGLSVWLTYMADRLFDVARRPMLQLRSLRHRFAKQHFHALWRCWCCVFMLNLLIAAIGLSINELCNGAGLLALCLLYTALNHMLSRHFFPKEMCVAIIFVGGVIVFLLPNAGVWPPAGVLALLCLINCLIIGAKERQVDEALRVRSLAQLPKRVTIALEVSCALVLCLLHQAWVWPIALSLGALVTIHSNQKRLSIETFRVLADGALLVGPTIMLLIDR